MTLTTNDTGSGINQHGATAVTRYAAAVCRQQIISWNFPSVFHDRSRFPPCVAMCCHRLRLDATIAIDDNSLGNKRFSLSHSFQSVDSQSMVRELAYRTLGFAPNRFAPGVLSWQSKNISTIKPKRGTSTMRLYQPLRSVSLSLLVEPPRGDG